MIKCDTDTFELAKLAVTEEFKGLKIASKLMERCIYFAKENGAKMIMLYTNQKLVPAIGLYKKYGFEEVALKHNKYLEADMKMKLTL
jgi:ribosomal protein S18 acetylase RimI-like enzyme